jgi:hypothetical protein
MIIGHLIFVIFDLSKTITSLLVVRHEDQANGK